MLNLTARAEVNGTRFDGIDLFLFDPHISIDIDDDGLKRLAEKIQSKGFVVGSVVAPVWPPTGGGSAMGTEQDRNNFVEQVRKACRIASQLRQLGVRPYGVVRIDSASGVAEWAQDPQGNQARIADTFRLACDVAESFGERLAAEGEICWGGMHSWRKMADLLQRVGRPQTLGFQADMAHTLLYTVGFNAPEDAILPQSWNWSEAAPLDEALKMLTDTLRSWTIDFHVAQNDATVKGSGTHDKTGHHCLPDDPNGKLSIVKHSAFWLKGPDGQPTKAFRHICWDGCMFPNAVMMQQETWNGILKTMIAVRDAHGWREAQPKIETPEPRPVTVTRKKTTKRLSPKRPKPKARKAAAPKRRAAAKRLRAKSVPKRKAKPVKKPRKVKAKSPARKTAAKRKRK
jgi:hypothetical protein